MILLEKNEERKNQILRPRNPRHRVIAQKSVFVRHPNGFLFPEDVDIITIPAHLKLPMLAYLHKYHNISTETIYNDLHGFIRNQSHEDAYTEFHRGLSSHLIGNELEISDTRALKLKPDLPDGYINRNHFSPALTDF